jgi:hypothetical protein
MKIEPQVESTKKKSFEWQENINFVTFQSSLRFKVKDTDHK